MRKMILTIAGVAMLAPAMVVPITGASAQYRDGDRRYDDNRRYDDRSDDNYRGQTWRDDRGRIRCKKSNGATGTIVGGVAGALLGRTIDTHGDRTVGTLGGAAAGALAGRAIDKGSSNGRCR